MNMRVFTYKMFLVTCLLLVAGYSNAQFKFTTNTNIGQTLTTDSVKGIQTFLVDFKTAKDSSYWKYDDDTQTTFTITVFKCQTQRGMQVNVYEADTAGAPKVINGDFECRDYGGNRNPVRVASIASLMDILAKYEEKNKGTADSLKNVRWKPSACLFDTDATGADQAFGAHPGKYKVVEYGFQFNFSGFSVTPEDLYFEIDTYDEGNTGKTASYKLTVAVGSATGVIKEINDFYITGSGKKKVSLAGAAGLPVSDFNNKKVFFFLRTSGTGTEIAEGSVDPTIVFDNFQVSYQMPCWVSPAAGIQANVTLNNAANPAWGAVGTENIFSLPLKTTGRIGTLQITNDWDLFSNRVFAFLAEGALKARDAFGKYSVDVPYTFTNDDEATPAKAKIVVAAPASGVVNDDLMFFFKATPASTLVSNGKLELNCGVRIWYEYLFKGAGIIDLSGIDNTNALKDTIADVPDGSVIVLKPGMRYSTGVPEDANYTFDKSLEIRSADPAGEMPVIECTKNFVTADADTIGSIVFKNISFVGDYDNNYVFNIDKSTVIGEIRFESCKFHKLRGIARMKGGTGVLDKFTMTDCVIDSIKDYGILCVDVKTWACNHIRMENSTISKSIMLFTSRNNSKSVNLESCTISEAPEKGRQMFRWRESGQNDVLDGISIRNTIWGHGWNLTGDLADVLLDGFDGMGNTSWNVENLYVPGEFGYAAGKDSIPGFPAVKLAKKAADLWVAPYSSDFNYKDLTFAGIGKAGDPRWNPAILGTLYASAGELDPVFVPGRKAYQLNLPAGTSAVTFTALCSEPSATVTLPGSIALTDGSDKVVEITVAGPGGYSSSVYTVYIHVASNKEILYVSGSNTSLLSEALVQDAKMMAVLKNAGYSVTYLYKYGITPSFNKFTSFDFSPYKALIFSPSAPSAGTMEYDADNYPIPCVSLQKDGPKSDKWGWIHKSNEYKEVKISSIAEADRLNALKMKVINTGQYITTNFTHDEVITWTSSEADSTDFSKIVLVGYKMNDSIPMAIPLITHIGLPEGFHCAWAIPAGASIGRHGVTDKRIVILGVQSDAMRFPTQVMDTLVIRSLEWVLGARTDARLITETLGHPVVYPNPAGDYAKIRFTLGKAQQVSLSLVNIIGQVREMTTLYQLPGGENELTLNTARLRDGIYLYILETEDQVYKGKLNVAR